MAQDKRYFDQVEDPETGYILEVRDTLAREQLTLKKDTLAVESLPSIAELETRPEDLKRALQTVFYCKPFYKQENVNDPDVANEVFVIENTGTTLNPVYEWAYIGTTKTTLKGFSSTGHTHEVVPETEVEDHQFTPYGSFSGSFSGTEGTTESNTHKHSYTPSGSVSGSFSGTAGTTGEHTHKHNYTPQGSVTGSFSGTAGTTGEHTHKHNYTPQGSVSGSFSGTAGTTGEHTHKHNYTPQGSVSGSFSGTAGTTVSGTADISTTKTKKKLTKKKITVAQAQSVDFTGSTTNSPRATGNLEADGGYNASKSVFNGIEVVNGVLKFKTKKMSVSNDAVTSLQASIDASKVTIDSSAAVSNQDFATGAVEDDNDGALLGDVTVSDNGHSHGFTPAGSLVSMQFQGTQGETDEVTHSHGFTPAGSLVSMQFQGTQGETDEVTHSHGFTPAGSLTNLQFQGTHGETSEVTHSHDFTPAGSLTGLQFQGTAGETNEVTHTHDFTPSGSVSGSISMNPVTLKHKVDNKKVRTEPDQEDEGSHAYDWYGIEFNEEEADPVKPRIGNMNLHRTLPIQTKMRRCLLKDDGTVFAYLDENDSRYYAQGSKDPQGRDLSGFAAPLTGSVTYKDEWGAKDITVNVQVMVEMPEHWRKVYRYTSDNKSYLRAMVSPYQQDTNSGWIHVRKGYMSAYEANITSNKLCSTSDIKNLSISMQDGLPLVTTDLATATAQSDITSKLPTTNITMNTLRTAARARNTVDSNPDTRWNMLVYEMYLSLYWLYVIEYANLNSQEAFTTALSAEGYHQGGLGAGCTTLGATNWNTFNGYRPFVPCGVTNCLGNNSGEVKVVIPAPLNDGSVSGVIRVNTYRGVENPFGHIYKIADGIMYKSNGTNQDVLRCDNPINYTSTIPQNPPADYIPTEYTSIGTNADENGFIKKTLLYDNGDINCVESYGSNTSYYCDYYINNANSGYYACWLSGFSSDSTRAGLSYIRSYNTVTDSHDTAGSRLCFFEK